MFRKGLFATTALIVAASVIRVAAQSGPSAHPAMAKNDTAPDANTEFLCHYGAFPVSAHYIGSSASFSSTWTHVAVPITGRGKTVRRITVEAAPSASTSSTKFEAGIYSATASGPGKLLSGGTGNARSSCGKVNVGISPLKLQRNTAYWVEETVHRGVSDMKNEIYWASDPKSKSKPYEQTHYGYNYFGNSSSYTSPWTEQSAGAYVRVR